VQGNQGS